MAEATPTKDAPKTPAKKDEAPVAEFGLNIELANATYEPPRGNWSDPPELAEHEHEYPGSHAKPPEAEVEKEREKIRKEGKERLAKAWEENNKKALERAKYDEKLAKERRAT